MRSEQEANRAIELYSDTVRRICMVHLKSYYDTEDIFQNVFLKYVLSSAVFESKEHEKAWFICVTINSCKDLLKNFFRSHTVPIEEISDLVQKYEPQQSSVLEAVLSLPDKYKDIVYLFYYEEYTAVEIARLMNKNVNTVYTFLSRAKVILRQKLGGEEFE